MGDACPLCLDELGAGRLTVTPCGHAFCGRCLSKWTATHHTCPLCRSALPVLEYANSPSALTARIHSLALGARVPGASRALPTRSLQSEVEQAERLREESRARRSTLQRRIDGYHAARVRPPSGKSPGVAPHRFSPRGTPRFPYRCHRFECDERRKTVRELTSHFRRGDARAAQREQAESAQHTQRVGTRAQ